MNREEIVRGIIEYYKELFQADFQAVTDLSIEESEKLLRYAEENIDALTVESERDALENYLEKERISLVRRKAQLEMKSVEERIEKKHGVKVHIQNMMQKEKMQKVKRFAIASTALVLAGSAFVSNMSSSLSAIATPKVTYAAEKEKTDKKENASKKANVSMKADYLKQHKFSIDSQTDFLKSALSNGIYANEKLTYSFFQIANVANTKESEQDTKEVKELKEKIRMEMAASPIQITGNYWDNFIVQALDDMSDATTNNLAFDANDLFVIDKDSAEDVNQVMQAMARLNENSEDKESYNFLVRFMDEYMAHINEKNPAASTLIIAMVSQLAVPGKEIRTNIEDEKLFDGVTSEFANQRKRLNQLLELNNFAIGKFAPNSEKNAASIANTSSLDQYNNFAGIKESKNAKLQLKFAAGYQYLTPGDAEKFADQIQLAGTILEYTNFANEYSDGVINGTITNDNFDLSNVFSAKESEKAVKTLKELTGYVTSYRSAKTEDEKAKIAEEYNATVYDKIRVDSDFNIHSSSTILALEMVAKIQNSDLGLKIGDDLFKILIGDDMTADCKVLIQDMDEFGYFRSHESYLAQALQDFSEGMRRLIVTDALKNNQDTSTVDGIMPSLYQDAINEFSEDLKKNVDNGGANLYTVITEQVFQNTKDVEFVRNANRENLYFNLSGIADGSLNFGTGVTWASSGSYAEEASHTVTVSGQGQEDSGIGTMTETEIQETEEEAKKELNTDYGYGFTTDDNGNIVPVINETFEDTEDTIVEEDTKIEDLPSDPEKNNDAVNDGSITPDEKDEMDQNNESFEGKDEKDEEIDYSGDPKDFLTDEGLAEVDKLNILLTQGSITEDEYNTQITAIFENYKKEADKKEENTNNNQNPETNPQPDVPAPAPDSSQDNKVNTPDNIGSLPSYDELIASGTVISKEEYDNMVNGNIELGEGQYNPSKPAPGTVLEMDGKTFIANENGEYVEQVDPNAKDEQISSSFEEATEEEKVAAQEIAEQAEVAPVDESATVEQPDASLQSAESTPEVVSTPAPEPVVVSEPAPAPEATSIPEPEVAPTPEPTPSPSEQIEMLHQLKAEIEQAYAEEAVAQTEQGKSL